MKIPFILVLLSFLTMVACSNGQSRKKSLSPSKQCEKNIDSIDIAKNIRLYIPENKQSVLKAYIDKPVCFGIRPEHISLSLNCKEMNTVTGALSIIENMGSEKYLYFTVNNKEFIAKVNDQSITTADIGKNLYFNLDTSFCHIFDFYTEENLTNYL